MVLDTCTRKAHKVAVAFAQCLKIVAYFNLGHSLGEVELAVEQQLLWYFAKEFVHGLNPGNSKHLFNILLGMRKIFHS